MKYQNMLFVFRKEPGAMLMPIVTPNWVQMPDIDQALKSELHELAKLGKQVFG